MGWGAALATVPLWAKILAVGSLALGKKLGVYAIGRAYGYPRLYRRIAEFSKMSIANHQRRRQLRQVVKYTFRLPNKLGPIIWGERYYERRAASEAAAAKIKR
eukprot:m.308085 g.308085  ORF g.308085 m.308085 type:complete len:103 (+) comp43357_c0_seq1:66-374(+)